MIMGGLSLLRSLSYSPHSWHGSSRCLRRYGSRLHAHHAVLEPWFDRPGIPQRLKEPPIWKQVFIGVICVYPLILLLNLVLAPLTGGLPSKFALLLNVVFLSTLLAYPVMPWVTGLLKTWLYPK